MPGTVATTASETTPLPKRYWWLKRLSLAALVLVLLLVGLRLIWGQRVQARLDQAIADIQAKGEPIHYEDLISEEIPDEENGAWHLMQALQNWPSVPGQPGVTIHDTDWYIEGEELSSFPDPITDNTAYLATCEPVLDTIRQGVAMEQARWFSGPMPADYNSFNLNTVNHLSSTRQLARLMEDAARRAFDSSDPALGFKILLLIGQHGDQVGRQRLSLIEALVTISIHALQHEAIGQQLAELTDEQVRDTATRQALIELRDWLMDESHHRESFIQCMIANRWSTHQYVLGIRDGSIPVATMFWGGDGYGRLIADTPGLSFVLQPLLIRSQQQCLLLDTEGIEQLKAHDNLRDTAGDPNDQTFEEIYEARPWLYPMFEELFFSDAPARTYYRQLATRRMTATAIAIRLYQADHDGRRPETLDALVPDYLARVSLDPFVGNRPIGYNPIGVVPRTAYDLGREADRIISDDVRAALPTQPLPLLYCVGFDYEDNDGVLIVNEYDGTVEWYSGDDSDDMRYLLVPEPEPIQALIDLTDSGILYQEFGFGPLESGEDEVKQEQDPGDDGEDEQAETEPSQGQ
ncbi:MAG: hypothetical protein KTR15_10225 [Phycisphaeraceae bacterium]|nr:hypothetical protein [Phycisphaeraceae bacterium]